MLFPQPVVSVAVEAQNSAERDRLMEVVRRLVREDPTFTYHVDEETGELILSGMGELYLEILQNRMRRQFNVTARFGRPRVSYRETVPRAGVGIGEFDKRVGDIRVTGKAAVEVSPRPRPPGQRELPPIEIELARRVFALPLTYREAVKEVLTNVCNAGGANGYPIVDVKVNLREISLNECPDPLVPLRASLTLGLRNAIAAAGTTRLEPVMTLELRVPESSVGAVMRDLGARRAEIRETVISSPTSIVRAFVPLVGMFGYSTDLRSMTQGQGSFSMEPYDFLPVPAASPRS